MHRVPSLLSHAGIPGITKQYLRRVPGLVHFYRTLKLNYLLLKTSNLRFVYPYTPGHYYSPLPDYEEVSARSQELFDRGTAACPGIDLREEAQLKLLRSFSLYYNDLPFPPQPGVTTRYYYENGYFSYADAITTYSVLRHYEPCNVVEIGSGFSSAAMLDVNDIFLENRVRFTFIEPYPERLFKLLKEEDKTRCTILQNQVQDVPPEVFQTLSANDILFIDSSHVVKAGSDVAHILFNIFPDLKPGVIVHMHDVFWPFEYPEEWVLAGRAWNEAYFLRSFLQFNDTFEIMYFNSFVEERYKDVLREKTPLWIKAPGSSIWLKKVA